MKKQKVLYRMQVNPSFWLGCLLLSVKYICLAVFLIWSMAVSFKINGTTSEFKFAHNLQAFLNDVLVSRYNKV